MNINLYRGSKPRPRLSPNAETQTSANSGSISMLTAMQKPNLQSSRKKLWDVQYSSKVAK